MGIKLIKKNESARTIVSRFTISNPRENFDEENLKEVLDRRFAMGEVDVRCIGDTKCEIEIKDEVLKAIDIHWIERNIGPIAALEVNCKKQ